MDKSISYIYAQKIHKKNRKIFFYEAVSNAVNSWSPGCAHQHTFKVETFYFLKEGILGYQPNS